MSLCVQRRSDLMLRRAGKAQLPFLNCLAFAPSVLPRLWAWLARLIGMPLEAPAGEMFAIFNNSLASRVVSCLRNSCHWHSTGLAHRP
eukprot:scaffold617955_cov39-Prasinocladus_malaysianus.AAC.1